MLKRITNGNECYWDVDIVGRGGLLYRAERKPVSVYIDTDIETYYVFLEKLNGKRELQGMFAGDLTIRMKPII